MNTMKYSWKALPAPVRNIIILVGALLAIGTTGYVTLERWPLREALYMTVITVSTVGYSEVRPLSPIGQIFTILLIFGGVGVLAYGLGNLVDYVVQGELGGALRRQRMARKIAKMNDHFVVCGYGRVGRQVVGELRTSHADLVVIDVDASYIGELERLGIAFIVGDPTHDNILQQAHIERARGLCVCLPNDATNVFVVLSARQMNRNLVIISRCNQLENQEKFRIAGANQVINPYLITGHRMAAQLLQPGVGEFLDVTLGRDDYDLRLREIIVGERSALVGQTLAATGVRATTGVSILAVRHDRLPVIASPGADYVIHACDQLICLGATEQLQVLAALADDPRWRPAAAN